MLGRTSIAGASVLVAALGGLGCSTAAVEDVSSTGSALTEGIVLVEREVSPEAEPQSAISAKFMRISPSVEPEVAERVVGSRLEQPGLGACMALPSSDEVPPLSGRASIELLDVGDVSVRVGKTAPVALATRAFPDVGDLVSGVFYTTRDDAADLPTGGFVVAATGSSQMDKFDIAADAPEPLEDVRVGDEMLVDGLNLEAARSATFSWKVSASANAEDRVLVDVTSPSGAVTRCAFVDQGEGVVPRDVLDVKNLGKLPSSATIEVHRVRRVFFGSNAIDAAEVRFDLSTLGRAIVANSGG